ncbi:Creatinase/aminopeptidase [Peniophora sp. CONT]|nr:Creatinase/aminopeptidase [Peniophora sp. CONT]
MVPSPLCMPFRSLRKASTRSMDAGHPANEKAILARTSISSDEALTTRKPSLPFRDGAERLAMVRELMEKDKLDYYIVPSEDAHQNENVAEPDKRLQWLSGFTGNAGQALVGKDTAYLVTDSRFWEQAQRQLDLNLWTIITAGAPDSPSNYIGWLADNAHSSRVSIDARTIPINAVTTIQTAFAKVGSTLVFSEENFVDISWGNDRPPPIHKPVAIHDIKFAGREASEKLRDVREWVLAQGHSGMLESALGNIAYVLNLRGDDVPYCPVFSSYLYVGLEQTTLFVDSTQLGSEVKKYLADLNVAAREYDEVWSFLRLAEWGDGKILLNGTTSYKVALSLTEPRYTVSQSIIDIMKGVKNEIEIEGFRRAYMRDGACFVRFFAWLEEAVGKGEQLTEWDAAECLTEYQRQAENFRGLKGAAMSCTGPNAALPHYSPTADDNRVIDTSTPYLMDSGGQYLDGTCDTTRTVHFRKPSLEQCEAFTRVLQAHIAIDTAIFPQNTSGRQLDVLARHKLWQDGLNYGHGTGHSFGSYLSVHEGPHGFSSEVPLVPGHVITNEPASYKSGHFGVRLESALVVRSVHTKHEFNGPIWLGFERLTCVPIQPKMCVKEMMSREERQWLKNHNRTCVERLDPLLRNDKQALRWLHRQAKFPLCF